MQTLHDTVGRHKLRDRNSHKTPNLNRRDFTFQAYKDWGRVLDMARHQPDLASQFNVKISQIDANVGATQAQTRKERYNEKRNAERAGAKDVRDAQRDAQLWSAVYGLGDFISLAAYARNRLTGYLVDTGGSRRKIRTGKRGHKVVVPVPHGRWLPHLSVVELLR
jgi:hypothetical protein